MRCNCCDRVLGDGEVLLAPDNKTFEPCATCMEVAMDAAYSDGWVRPGDEEFDLDDDEMDVLDDPEIETLDEDSYRSYFDHCDVSQVAHPFDPDQNEYD